MELTLEENHGNTAYKLIDFHAGYTLKLDKRQNKFSFREYVLNALNEVYILTHKITIHSAQYSDFDAKSAGVFFIGRRINLSAKLTFSNNL